MSPLSQRPSSILVTGGSSALGDHVLPWLVSREVDVIATARSDVAGRSVEASGARASCLDLEDFRAAVIPPAQVVLHLAGIRFADAAVELARQAGAQHLIAISSASATALGHPLRDRILAWEERLSNADAAEVTILRPTMIYGSARDRNVRILDRLVRAMPVVPRFRGGGRIQPVLVDDLVEVIGAVALGRWPTRPDGPISVGGPSPIRIGDLVSLLADLREKRRLPIPISVSAIVRATKLLGLTHGRFGHAVAMLHEDRVVTPLSELGVPPVVARDIQEGLRLAISRYPT